MSALAASAPSLDLCFLLDATGSMGPMIAAVKEQIRTIVRDIEGTHPACVVRLAAVAYRDYNDQPMVEKLPFTLDVQGFETFVAGLQAKGGDDMAEDVISGLEEACKLDWQSAARMVIHFADAPCHGSAYHTALVHDKYRAGDKYGRNTRTFLQRLANSCNVNTYQFMHLNDTTKRMLQVFKREAVTQDWFLESDIQVDQRDHIVREVFRGSVHSISRSRHHDSVTSV